MALDQEEINEESSSEQYYRDSASESVDDSSSPPEIHPTTMIQHLVVTAAKHEEKFFDVITQVGTLGTVLLNHANVLEEQGDAIKSILGKQTEMTRKIAGLETQQKTENQKQWNEIKRNDIRIRGIISKQDRMESDLARLERMIKEKPVTRSTADFSKGKTKKMEKKSTQGRDRIRCEDCGSQISRNYLTKHLQTIKCRKQRLERSREAANQP